MPALVAAAQPRLVTLNAQNIGNLLWAWAHARVTAPAPVLRVAAARHEAFNPQGVANVLWALAEVHAKDSVALALVRERQLGERLHRTR